MKLFSFLEALTQKNKIKRQFFIRKSKISKWLDANDIENYTINRNLSVDVTGDVDISNKNLKIIPIRFRKISGNFNCSHNFLTTLAGSPKIVGGDFICNHNKLINLFGSPEIVGVGEGLFDCSDNKLKTLIGIPKIVGIVLSDNIKNSSKNCLVNF